MVSPEEVLLVPRFSGPKGSASVLGLFDVVLPGLLLVCGPACWAALPLGK